MDENISLFVRLQKTFHDGIDLFRQKAAPQRIVFSRRVAPCVEIQYGIDPLYIGNHENFHFHPFVLPWRIIIAYLSRISTEFPLKVERRTSSRENFSRYKVRLSQAEASLEGVAFP